MMYFIIFYLLIGALISVWALSHIWSQGYGGRTWAIKLVEFTYLTLIWPAPVFSATYQFIRDNLR